MFLFLVTIRQKLIENSSVFSFHLPKMITFWHCNFMSWDVSNAKLSTISAVEINPQLRYWNLHYGNEEIFLSKLNKSETKIFSVNENI